jgi:hypothetical protein
MGHVNIKKEVMYAYLNIFASCTAVYSESNENQYQSIFLGVKGGQHLRLTT